MSKMTSLGDLIRTYRNNRGLSQAELAHLIGVTKRSIEQLETGERKTPTLDTFLRIASILSSSNPEKLPETIEWDRLPLLTKTFFKLASFDEQSIHLFNETFPDYIH